MNAHAEFDTDRVRIHVHHARTWWQRARGLIAHPEPRHGAGMFFPKTNAVHGIGMAHALDIVFLDRDQKVLRCCRLPRFGKVRPPGWISIRERGCNWYRMKTSSVRRAARSGRRSKTTW